MILIPFASNYNKRLASVKQVPDLTSLGLFPSILKDKLHRFKKVFEMYSSEDKLEFLRDTASLVGGPCVRSARTNEMVRVLMKDGQTGKYCITLFE